MSSKIDNEEKNQSGGKLRLIGAVYLILYVCVLNGLCTQFIAYRVAYHRALGTPLFGNIYSPFAWWDWMFKFYDYAPQSYTYAFIFFALGILVGMLVYVLWVGFKSRSSRKHDDLHGSARFADMDDVQDSGLLPQEGKSGQGVYCGAFDDPETGNIHYLRHDGPEHICALAPTRSGKGVGLVIPTLLSWPHSVVVLDRKGENYAMTSGWRKKYANNVILRFDPAKPGNSCAWNPVEEIQFKTRFQVSDTQSIALMIVDSDGKGIESDHFRTAAYELLVGLMLHALYKGEQIGRTPCLQDVAHMLTGVGDFAAPDTANELADDEDGDPKALAGLFEEMREVRIAGTDPATVQADREAQIVITGVGTRMATTPARELGSIISTANNALQLYRDPIVGENTSRSDFKIADLMDHDRPVSLYFISTLKTSRRLTPLTRLLVTMIVTTLADWAALSAYNTGDFNKGYINGYLARYGIGQPAAISVPAVNSYTADTVVYLRQPPKKEEAMSTKEEASSTPQIAEAATALAPQTSKTGQPHRASSRATGGSRSRTPPGNGSGLLTTSTQMVQRRRPQPSGSTPSQNWPESRPSRATCSKACHRRRHTPFKAAARCQRTQPGTQASKRSTSSLTTAAGRGGSAAQTKPPKSRPSHRRSASALMPTAKPPGPYCMNNRRNLCQHAPIWPCPSPRKTKRRRWVPSGTRTPSRGTHPKA